MQVSVRSNALVNIILSFLYLESWRCFIIDREKVDKSDILRGNNCNGITNAIVEAQRCRCSITPKSSIVSKETGSIFCTSDNEVDKSKYERYVFVQYCFLLVVTVIVLLNTASYTRENWSLELAFYEQNLHRAISFKQRNKNI